MPGYDGTGPAGMGAATGGGWGNCRPNNTFGNAGFGRGRGRCSGRGFGQGYGAGAGFRRGPRFFQGNAYAAAPPVQPMSRDEEMAVLKSEAEYAKNTLDTIQQRIDALENNEGA